MALTVAAPEYYRQELGRANEAVAHAIVTHDDGWKGIDSTLINDELAEYYTGLTATGYANGWIE